jgi:hypothetical protein
MTALFGLLASFAAWLAIKKYNEHQLIKNIDERAPYLLKRIKSECLPDKRTFIILRYEKPPDTYPYYDVIFNIKDYPDKDKIERAEINFLLDSGLLEGIIKSKALQTQIFGGINCN